MIGSGDDHESILQKRAEDPALRQDGRAPTQHEVSVPARNGQAQLLRIHLGDLHHDLRTNGVEGGKRADQQSRDTASNGRNSHCALCFTVARRHHLSAVCQGVQDASCGRKQCCAHGGGANTACVPVEELRLQQLFKVLEKVCDCRLSQSLGLGSSLQAAQFRKLHEHLQMSEAAS
ncbi:hypothetical protein D3C71_1562730 [compost metagenome]